MRPTCSVTTRIATESLHRPPSATVARQSKKQFFSLEKAEKGTRRAEKAIREIASLAGYRVEDFYREGKVGKQVHLVCGTFVADFVLRKERGVSSSDRAAFSRVLRLHKSTIKIALDEAKGVDGASSTIENVRVREKFARQQIQRIQDLVDAEKRLPAYLKLSTLEMGLFKSQMFASKQIARILG
jgi:hypothetical protein